MAYAPEVQTFYARLIPDSFWQFEGRVANGAGEAHRLYRQDNGQDGGKQFHTTSAILRLITSPAAQSKQMLARHFQRRSDRSDRQSRNEWLLSAAGKRAAGLFSEPFQNTRIVETPFTEHRTAQSIWPGRANSPLMTGLLNTAQTNDADIKRMPPVLDAIERDTRQIGFTMGSELRTGSLLRTLAATKPGGRILELGTGTGIGTAWLLAGMDAHSKLDSVDRDPSVQEIARDLFYRRPSSPSQLAQRSCVQSSGPNQ